jgi:hypothetical protein
MLCDDYFSPFPPMDRSPRPSYSRNTIGEALIAAIALGGFLISFLQGKIALQDLGTFAGFLGLFVGFYFALLFCRMLFYWMTGGDQYPWWEYQQRHEQKKK